MMKICESLYQKKPAVRYEAAGSYKILNSKKTQ